MLTQKYVKIVSENIFQKSIEPFCLIGDMGIFTSYLRPLWKFFWGCEDKFLGGGQPRVEDIVSGRCIAFLSKTYTKGYIILHYDIMVMQ